MTTGKTVALTRQTFVDKVISLLFNMLSRLVVTFLPRSKRLLISWLQSPSIVIWDSPAPGKKMLSVFSKNNFLILCRKVVGLHVCFVLNNLRRVLSTILTL